MPFRLCRFALLFLAVGLYAEKPAAVDAVQLLAFGQPGPTTTGTFVERFAAATTVLQSQPTLLAQTRLKAKLDAFGATGTQAEPSDALTYVDQMRDHLAWLSGQPAIYENVIQRAYRHVINRDAYTEEIAYWNQQPETLSYVLLVACIEDWARRNQPGLMVTGGKPTISINCEFLTTARVSPSDAAAARPLAQLPPITAPGNHVIAPGAAHLAASGGIHFIAVGASTLSLHE